jgi:alkanesulfonate monooxygenase SsuD/methylene tetrahydromethanopterin reductase-like flavin-dependent oxidoreductase (luciferase family)
MKLYNFDLLAYPDIPGEAPGTPILSTYFDPTTGARNYREHIDEMAYCEELGFDGVVFNEHHYSAYGTMPSPNLIAAALSQRTQRMKIGVLGKKPVPQRSPRCAISFRSGTEASTMRRATPGRHNPGSGRRSIRSIRLPIFARGTANA